MANIRWNPWNLRQIIEDDWDIPTIPGISRLMGQGLNLYETDEAVIAEAALPGIKEGEVDVTIDDGVVRITGTTDRTSEQKSKRRYFMNSLSSSYSYSFKVPEGVILDKDPECVLEDGVLSLIFEKTEKNPPKKIKIGSKKIPVREKI